MSFSKSAALLSALVLSASAIASTPDPIPTPGDLYQYNIETKKWESMDQKCGFKFVKAYVRTDETFGSPEAVFVVKTAGFQPVQKYALKEVTFSSVALDIQGDTQRYSGQSDRVYMYMLAESRATLEQMVEHANAGTLKVREIELQKSTLTSGYFGGPSNKWQYKCVF